MLIKKQARMALLSGLLCLAMPITQASVKRTLYEASGLIAIVALLGSMNYMMSPGVTSGVSADLDCPDLAMGDRLYLDTVHGAAVAQCPVTDTEFIATVVANERVAFDNSEIVKRYADLRRTLLADRYAFFDGSDKQTERVNSRLMMFYTFARDMQARYNMLEKELIALSDADYIARKNVRCELALLRDELQAYHNCRRHGRACDAVTSTHLWANYLAPEHDTVQRYNHLRYWLGDIEVPEENAEQVMGSLNRTQTIINDVWRDASTAVERVRTEVLDGSDDFLVTQMGRMGLGVGASEVKRLPVECPPGYTPRRSYGKAGKQRFNSGR